MTPASPRRPTARGRPEPRTDSDRGSAAVEAVLILPLMVVLTMVLVQAALIWHGRHVAQAAAHTGALAAAAYRATADTGRNGATDYLDQVAPNLLAAPDVTVTRDLETATVVVRAHVLTVVPFADFDITEQASAPVESFVGAGR